MSSGVGNNQMGSGKSSAASPWLARNRGNASGSKRHHEEDLNNVNIQEEQLASTFPDDLMPDILKRLPLRSLCRFMCVSKYLSSLIIQNFHESSMVPVVCRIASSLPGKDREEELLNDFKPLHLCSIDSHGVVNYDVCNPIHFNGENIFDIRCCNGLLCCEDFYDSQYRICNPISGELMTLPNHTEFFVYLGFHPPTNKFKVLGGLQYPYFHIYTLGETNSSWRPVNSTPPEGSGNPRTDPFCIKGIMYWYTDTETIISFDLGSETFGVIKGPKRCLEARVLSIFEFEGYLCLRNCHQRRGKLDLWMLKDRKVDNGWVMIARVDMPTGVDDNWIEPYPVRKGGIILAQCHKKGSESFYLYNFFTRQLDTIKILGPYSYFTVNDFVKNYVSLKDL